MARQMALLTSRSQKVTAHPATVAFMLASCPELKVFPSAAWTVKQYLRPVDRILVLTQFFFLRIALGNVVDLELLGLRQLQQLLQLVQEQHLLGRVGQRPVLHQPAQHLHGQLRNRQKT